VAQESRRKNRANEPLPAAGMDPPSSQTPLDQLLVEEERWALVWRALMKLSVADRTLILKMYGQECDRAEVAHDLGISPSGLNVRLCRALKRLRACVLMLEPRSAYPHTCHVPVRKRPGAPDTWATMAA
jgi:DNA-directed RNA polymerase specialized sigma24 family protein